MNYKQLVQRCIDNQKHVEKSGGLRIAVIGRDKSLEEALEIIAFSYVANKYKQDYIDGKPLPEDFTDELFETRAELRSGLDL